MHVLVTGMTESGKTTLAKLVCRALTEKKKSTVVLDPIQDPEWECYFNYKDPEPFREFLEKNKSLYCFVDESAEAIGRYNDDMNWIVTRGRHYGHSCWLITQGVTQLPPIVREQCSRFFVFASGRKQAEHLAEQCNEESLKNLPQLQPLEFVEVGRFTEPQGGKIVIPSGGNGRVPLDKLTIQPYDCLGQISTLPEVPTVKGVQNVTAKGSKK